MCTQIEHALCLCTGALTGLWVLHCRQRALDVFAGKALANGIPSSVLLARWSWANASCVAKQQEVSHQDSHGPTHGQLNYLT